MLKFVLPTEENAEDVLSFYSAIEKIGGECIGIAGYKNYEKWLIGMQNRHKGENLPEGYVRENFYLCYENNRLIGVFSLKFELTDFLLKYGGHIGYAVLPALRNRGLATQILKQGLAIAKDFGFDKILCICDNDNYASEKVILKNGGIFENELYDPDEKVTVKRFWINL